MTTALLHLALLHGVREPERLRERVETFTARARGQVVAPASVFVGDAVEKGQTAPDRRNDLSGEPLFLVVNRLAAEDERASDNLLTGAESALAEGAHRLESWHLRERFTYTAPRSGADERDAWMQIVAMNVDPAVQDEFDEWYEQEHVARIASVAPEFISVQRFEALGGSPRHFALWRLTDRKAPERDPWLSASETPWTRRIRRFMRDRRRLVLVPFAK
jgi:hypothetical protein